MGQNKLRVDDGLCLPDNRGCRLCGGFTVDATAQLARYHQLQEQMLLFCLATVTTCGDARDMPSEGYQPLCWVGASRCCHREQLTLTSDRRQQPCLRSMERPRWSCARLPADQMRR